MPNTGIGTPLQGSAIIVGPVFEGEGAWGMAVVEVEDQAAAQALADGDPIITSGFGFRFDILPMPSIILAAARRLKRHLTRKQANQDLNNGHRNPRSNSR